MKTQWYVIYFKAKSAKKISETLTRKKIENYFPIGKVVENQSVDKKVVDQPLFSSYLFVHTTEKQLITIKKLPSIINVVYWLGKPVTINEAEINMMKRFLTEHVNVKVEKITIGDQVGEKFNNQITAEDGSFTKIINKKINIVLPTLGYSITAGVDTSNVRIISSDKVINNSKLTSSKIFNPVQIFNNF